MSGASRWLEARATAGASATASPTATSANGVVRDMRIPPSPHVRNAGRGRISASRARLRLLPEPGPVGPDAARLRDAEPPGVQTLLPELDAREAIVVTDDDGERHAIGHRLEEQIGEHEADE